MTQVKSIKKDNGIKSTSKDALDLFEATSIATETGPINCWDEHLAAQIVDIFETHSVRESKSASDIRYQIDLRSQAL